MPGPDPPSQEGTPIDIIFLVERLESLIANGKKLPLTTNVVVDQNAALGLIDELRVAVPEEVRAAKRINAEGERIIEKAQDEAERIVAKAQEQAAFLIDERGLTQAAEAREPADHRRGARATPTRSGAAPTSTPSSVLVGLEGDVVKTLQSIKKGIALLDERRADARGRRRRTGRRRDDRRAWEDEAEERVPADAVTMSGRPPDGPLAWNVAGLLARRRRRRRATYDVDGVRDRPRRRPRPGRADRRARPARPDEPRDPRHAPTSTTALAAECSRCLRDVASRSSSRIDEEYLPVARPRDRRARSPIDDEPEVAAPDRPPRARPRAAGPRGDLAGRADRAAVPPGLPRACASSAASRLDEGVHDHPDDDIDPRLEALRAFRADDA